MESIFLLIPGELEELEELEVVPPLFFVPRD